jgi:hypothetical protein
MKTHIQCLFIALAIFAGIQLVSAQDTGVTWTPQNSGSSGWTFVASSADGADLHESACLRGRH